jgi:hypothetical protein
MGCGILRTPHSLKRSKGEIRVHPIWFVCMACSCDCKVNHYHRRWTLGITATTTPHRHHHWHACAVAMAAVDAHLFRKCSSGGEALQHQPHARCSSYRSDVWMAHPHSRRRSLAPYFVSNVAERYFRQDQAGVGRFYVGHPVRVPRRLKRGVSTRSCSV